QLGLKSPCSTQIDPAPRATSCGADSADPLNLGTGIRSTTSWAGSIRTSIGDVQSVTQTAPSPTASPHGTAAPVLSDASTVPVPGRILVSVPAGETVHSAPCPKLERTGPWTGTCRTSLPVPAETSASKPGSTSDCAPELSVPPLASRTPAAAAPAASASAAAARSL